MLREKLPTPFYWAEVKYHPKGEWHSRIIVQELHGKYMCVSFDTEPEFFDAIQSDCIDKMHEWTVDVAIEIRPHSEAGFSFDRQKEINDRLIQLQDQREYLKEQMFALVSEDVQMKHYGDDSWDEKMCDVNESYLQ